MSITTGINYFYDFLGLDQSNFKIFYDFSPANHSSTVINSVSFGDPQYSGTAGLIATQNNSGLFSASNQNRIKINNVSQSDFSSDFSFLFKFRTARTNGVLFSSLTGTAFKSGFNIGVNDANHLYFQYYDNAGPVILTSETRLAETNVVGVSVGLNNIGVNWYDVNSHQFVSEDFSINSDFLLFSNQWHLGGNILPELGAQNFSGYYAGFLGFNRALSRNSMTRLVSGFYSYPTLLPAVSGQTVSTGIVGFATSLPTSGITGFSYQFSGFKSVGEGEDLFASPDDELYTPDDIIFYASPLGGCGPTYPVYSITPEFGMLSSVSGFFPLYGPITGNFQISPERSGVAINTGRLMEMGYDSVSYTWRDLYSQSSEIYNSVSPERVNYVNKNGVFDIVRGDFSADSFYPSGNCNAFLNGVFQVESGFQTTGQFFNVGKSGIADFFVDSQYFDFKEAVFTSDNLLYDNNNQQNRAIVNYSGEASLPRGNFDLIFGNGQKLVSGEDYTVAGSNFNFSSQIQSVLSGGKLLFVSGKDFQRNTGDVSAYKTNKFLPNSTSYYLNGIRHPKQHFVEHSYLAPLSGQYLLAENLSLVNNNVMDDWVG